MYIDKLIKREISVLIVSILVVLILFIGVSFSYFLLVDKGKDNTISVGDLKISFCEDETCNKGYENFGQVIGTTMVDGKSVAKNMYPYISNEEALKSTPYIFNIKNTGSLKSILTIKLKEDKDYEYNGNYKNLVELYSNNIKIGISNCSNHLNRDEVTIRKYGELNNNIILTNEVLNKGEEKTYCLWTWLDENTPNDVYNTYFVANLDFEVEYKPEY